MLFSMALTHAWRTVRFRTVCAQISFILEALKLLKLSHLYRFCRPGGYSEELPPDPIPNSVVKFLSADGTTS